VGVIVGTYNKDVADSTWDNDDGMRAYRAFFVKYLPGSAIDEGGYLVGYNQGVVLEQMLKQCGDDLSRENILKQAKSLNNFTVSGGVTGHYGQHDRYRQSELDANASATLGRLEMATVRRGPERQFQ
jgi:hypothetical protein